MKPDRGSVLCLAVAALLLGAQALEAQNWRTVTSSRQLTDQDEVEVRVTYGVGILTLGPAADASLYRARLRFDEDTAAPIAEYDDNQLHVGISRLENRRIDVKNWSSEGSLDLELSPSVPMDLTLEFGAVKADLDLTGLALSELDLQTGASESVLHVDTPNPERMGQASFQVGAADFTVQGLGNLNADHVTLKAGVGSVTLDLAGEWPQDGSVDIEMGLGALELRIPSDLGIRLSKSSFLTSVDTDGMVKRGSHFYSVNWDNADRKVDIALSAAFGSVDIVWTR